MTAPAYDEIATHEDLVVWSRDYCKEVRREWLVDVRFDLVEWEVSTRAKRRAAAVKRPKIPEAEVGSPVDWETVEAAGGRRADGRPFPATLSLTWDAFEAFERTEWESTLRHELIHLEQYQRCGTTDHGPEFKARAEELDTEVHCETFSDPKYVLRCESCDALVAHRYRDCKLVRRADEYRSSCCESPLVVE
ncbi:SprT-like domain-containing protein [Halosimplex aquaticum]|uniref:SprT-like domain-containing protein n=1 Tax=Halosimplex aquaticum TaxID=3026162 RepID=A0ABD5Y3R6_9EURY|nr:SprT-like domain-containing protein [Halosimplex aquaticum]